MAAINGQDPPQYGAIDFGVISRAWPIFQANWQAFLISGAFIGVPMIVFQVAFMLWEIPMMLGVGNHQSLESMNADLSSKILAIFPVSIGLGLLMGFGVLVVDVCICRMSLVAIRTGRAEVSDFLAGFKFALQALLAGLITQLAAGLGMLLCCIPNILLMGLLGYTQCAIADGLGAVDALKRSWEMTKFQLLMALAFVFIMAMIGSMGSYVLYIGIVASYPFARLCVTLSYEEVLRGPMPPQQIGIAAPPLG